MMRVSNSFPTQIEIMWCNLKALGAVFSPWLLVPKKGSWFAFSGVGMALAYRQNQVVTSIIRKLSSCTTWHIGLNSNALLRVTRTLLTGFSAHYRRGLSVHGEKKWFFIFYFFKERIFSRDLDLVLIHKILAFQEPEFLLISLFKIRPFNRLPVLKKVRGPWWKGF